MKYRKLGSSDLLVSEVCLGTMTWANQNSEEEAHEQIERFVELGGNFVDTAELYPVPPGEEEILPQELATVTRNERNSCEFTWTD